MEGTHSDRCNVSALRVCVYEEVACSCWCVCLGVCVRPIAIQGPPVVSVLLPPTFFPRTFGKGKSYIVGISVTF